MVDNTVVLPGSWSFSRAESGAVGEALSPLYYAPARRSASKCNPLPPVPRCSGHVPSLFLHAPQNVIALRSQGLLKPVVTAEHTLVAQPVTLGLTDRAFVAIAI